MNIILALLIVTGASAGVEYKGPEAPADAPPVNECADARIQPQLDKVASILKEPLKCGSGQAKFKAMTDVYVKLSQSADNCPEASYKEVQKALRALNARLDGYEEKCGL